MSKTLTISDTLSDAILRYRLAVQQWENGHCEEGYTTKIEIPKLHIADALLESLEIPTSPECPRG